MDAKVSMLVSSPYMGLTMESKPHLHGSMDALKAWLQVLPTLIIPITLDYLMYELKILL